MRHLLAASHADVEAGEIGDGVGPHRHAIGLHRGVDILRQRAVLDREIGHRPPRRENAVANKAITIAAHNGQLAHALADGNSGLYRIARRLCAFDHLDEPHDVGRREEMHADDVGRSAGCFGDLVHVEV